MPAKFDGVLDHGRMEEVKLDPTTWKPIRPSRWSLDVIRPKFLALRPNSPRKPVRRTAWLDGLRGFAALMVYIHHNQLWAHGFNGNFVYENSFGYDGKHYFAALPVVRHFFSGGHYAVAIFFVISGYVLSVKTLSLIQKNQHQAAADTVGSALFRRWLRLYIPVIAVTFLWMSQRHWTKMWMDFGDMKPTYREQVVDWYRTFKNYSFVFLTGEIYVFSLTYQPHTWSIPVEFKGSIIIYTTLLALSRCTRNARLWCQAFLIFYFLYIADGWYGAMFVGGMMLCDLDLLADDDQLPAFFAKLDDFKELIFFHLFIVALYLGGVPSCESDHYDKLLSKSPGWIWLSKLTPQAVFDAKWFFLFWAAFLTVASVPRLPWLKHFFETRFCQYLARISFALYLVHGLVIYSLGDRLYAAVGLLSKEKHKEHIPGWINVFPMSQKGPMGFELAFWAPQLIILPVTLWAAELVTKLVDEPSVKFTSWLYRKVQAAPASPKR